MLDAREKSWSCFRMHSFSRTVEMGIFVMRDACVPRARSRSRLRLIQQII